MNAIVSALRLDALPTRWRRAGIIAFGTLALAYVVYKLVMTFVFRDENRRAGEEIVAAVEAYKAANKRYPENLAQLQPKYVGKIPSPAPGTNFVYGTPSDGSAAWFGYQTPRGMLNEYDSQTRKWRELDFDDSHALRMPTRQFLLGPKQ